MLLGLLDESTDEEEVPVAARSLKGKSRIKSGLERRALDYVVNPQIWPHMKLQYEYCGKDINFSDLNFRMLIAGELEIISDSNLSGTERAGRLR